MIEEFVVILEKFRNTKRTELSLVDMWNDQPPKAANGRPLKKFLANVANPSRSLYECLLTMIEHFSAYVPRLIQRL